MIVNRNEFDGGLPGNTGDSHVVFWEKHVPYKIDKCSSIYNCKLCLKFNPSHSFTSSSTNTNYEIIVPSHIFIIIITENRSENTPATVRRKTETRWFLRLEIGFHFGLNGKIGDEHQRNNVKPIGLSHQDQASQAFSKNNSFNCFLNLYKNKLKKDLKSYLIFGRSITSSPNKKKLKELAILLNYFVHDQRNSFFIFKGL